MKRCTDCKHYVPPRVTISMMMLTACTHENNQSVVDGSLRESPHALRYSYASDACGLDGRWFEPKEESPSAANGSTK